MIAPPLRASVILPNCESLIHFSKLLSPVRPRVSVTSPAFGRPGSFLMMYLPSGAVLLQLDDVLLHLQAAHLGDVLDRDAVELEAEGVADGAVEVGKSHGALPLVVGYVVGGHSLTRLVPPENWDSRKMTNSAGLTGATPISQTTWPASMPSAGLVSRSHLT